jgi:excisionase family DNA binding protein
VNDDRLMTAEELAELLNVPVGWVREHTRSGHLPAVKLGRYWRYRREAVLDWLAQQEAGGAAWRKHRPQVSA